MKKSYVKMIIKDYDIENSKKLIKKDYKFEKILCTNDENTI